MIFFPVGTDAPIYHRPVATIFLIVTNCVCFVLTGFGDTWMTDPWTLHFGTINPLEWLSSMFAHGSWGHLAMNMIFLWVFGLIVEGKIGWRRMLSVYLAIGISQAALIQFIMLPWPWSRALGASSAIMGLMAMSVVWAPKNDCKIFYWIIIPGTVDIAVMYVAMFYLGCDLLSFILFDQGMGTAALHLSGAGIGFYAGVLFLKKGWVNCENWDLFRVLSGTYGPHAEKATAVGAHADPELMFGKSDVVVQDDLPDTSTTTKHRKRLTAISEMIKSGNVMDASEELLLLRMEDSDATVGEPLLKKLAIGLMQADMLDDAEVYLEEYIDRFPDISAWARVRYANILLSIRKRPAAALATLKQVQRSQLAPEQLTTAKKIIVAAKKQVKAGVQDAEPDW